MQHLNYTIDDFLRREKFRYSLSSSTVGAGLEYFFFVSYQKQGCFAVMLTGYGDERDYKIIATDPMIEALVKPVIDMWLVAYKENYKKEIDNYSKKC